MGRVALRNAWKWGAPRLAANPVRFTVRCRDLQGWPADGAKRPPLQDQAMLSASRLLNGQVGTQEALRYGRRTDSGPAHLLHYSKDKTPIVVWNATRRCNLHCGHCYADAHDRDYPSELNTEEGHRLLEDLAAFGVPTVLFSGGEPLTRPDVLELATKAGELGMRTVLSTNGTKIDAAKAKEIAAAGSPTSASASTGSGRSTTRSAARRGRSTKPSRASGPRRPPACAPASASPSTPSTAPSSAPSSRSPRSSRSTASASTTWPTPAAAAR